MREIVKFAATWAPALPLLAAAQARAMLAGSGATAWRVPGVAPASGAAAEAGAASWSDLSAPLTQRRRDLAVAVEYLAALSAKELAASWRELVVHPVDAWRFFLPLPGALVAWRELLNKAEVFLLVSQVSALLEIPAQPPVDLSSLVARAYGLTPYSALWAVEGVGHDYTDLLWAAAGRQPVAVLTAPALAGLPEKSLLMLHAGLGLAFAQDELRGVTRRTANLETELAARLDQIVELCRASSRRGYVGAALESIGLVTRTFHPDLVQGVGRVLQRRHPEVTGFYWHGVGRAIYFLPVNFLPCGEATWRGHRMVAEETPDTAARASAMAGLAWAVVLVNQRQPAVVADLLGRHGDELAATPAFAYGVGSSLVMRFATTPEAPFTPQFCGFRPREPRVAALWESQVRQPCSVGIERWYPLLRREHRLDELFRYHSPGELEAGA